MAGKKFRSKRINQRRNRKTNSPNAESVFGKGTNITSLPTDRLKAQELEVNPSSHVSNKVSGSGSLDLRPTMHYPFVKNALARLGSAINDATYDATRNSSKHVKGHLKEVVKLNEHEFAGDGSAIFRNLNNDSDDMTGSGWAPTNGTVDPVKVADPDGNLKAYTFTATSNDANLRYDISPADIGTDVCNSIWVRRRTGTGEVYIFNGGSNFPVIPVTSEWKRFSTGGVSITDAVIRSGVRLQTSGDQVDVCRAQIQDVNLQSNQNPNDYAPVGTAIGPEILTNPLTYTSWTELSGAGGQNGAGIDLARDGGGAQQLRQTKYMVTGRKYVVNCDVSAITNNVSLYMDGSSPEVVFTASGTQVITYAGANGLVNLELGATGGLNATATVTAFSVNEASTGLLTDNHANGNAVSDGTVADGPDIWNDETALIGGTGCTYSRTPIDDLYVYTSDGGYGWVENQTAVVAGQNYQFEAVDFSGSPVKIQIAGTNQIASYSGGVDTFTASHNGLLVITRLSGASTSRWTDVQLKSMSSNVVIPGTGVILRDEIADDFGGGETIMRQAVYHSPVNSEVLETLGEHRAKDGRKYTVAGKVVYLDGVSGSYISSPDSVAASQTGSICLIGGSVMTDWTPLVEDRVVIAKSNDTANLRAYKLMTTQSNGLRVIISDDGLFDVNGDKTSTELLSFINGTWHWLMAIINLLAGEITFHSSDQGRDTDLVDIVWVQLGDALATTLTSIDDNSALVEIGSSVNGTSGEMEGSIGRAYVIPGINPYADPVVSFDANDHVSGESKVDNPVLGADKVTNGQFVTDSGWTKGAGWSIAEGSAIGAGATGNLQQTIPTDAGVPVKVVIEVEHYHSGTINRVQIGTIQGDTWAMTANGLYETEIIPDTTHAANQLYIVPSNFNGRIKSITINGIERWTLNGSADTVKPGTTLSTFGTDLFHETVDDTVASGGVLFDVGYHTIEGLLVESFSSSNEALHSEEFDDAVYVPNSVTVTPDYAIAPNRTKTADRAVYVGGLGSASARALPQSITLSGGTSGKTVTVSLWVSGTTKFRFKNTHGGIIDNFSPDIQATTTSKRYDFTVVNAASAGNGLQICGIVAATDDSAFDLNVWGLQVNQGILESYIQTTTAPATRTAESIISSLDDIDDKEGMLYAVVKFPLDKAGMGDGNQGIFSTRDSGESMLWTSNVNGFLYTYDSSTFAFVDLPFVANEDVKIQISWSAAIGKYQIWATSSSGGSVTSGLIDYGGSYIRGTVAKFFYGMGVGCHILDAIAFNAFVETDHTGLDS